MKEYPWISILYYVSAAYDGILGLAFLSMPLRIFDWCGTTPPNHIGYVHFPAALLIIFAFMFISIARNPLRNRNLIPYGILFKVSYCAVVFGHWFTRGLPDMWKSFALFDACFAVLFVWSYMALSGKRKESQTNYE